MSDVPLPQAEQPKKPKAKSFSKIPIRKATDAEASLPTFDSEQLDMKPSSADPVVTVVRGLFGKKSAPAVSKPAAIAPVPVPVAAAAASVAVAGPSVAITLAPEPFAPAPSEPSAPAPALAASEPAKPKKRIIKIATLAPGPSPGSAVAVKDPTDFRGTEFESLAEAIRDLETRSPYTTPLPEDGFIPQTRRGFTDFISQTYSSFKLKLPDTKPDYDACKKLGAGGAQKAEIYQYQEFVRDYMRWESPYRGVLVYHGLGSGKTCTAIAASEALFSTSNRKIIVMTPFSLRKNFINEITFCGFQYYRLQNHWTAFELPEKTTQSMEYNFARTVLKIPALHLKKAQRIWVPDFSKKDPNYKQLSSQEQSEIREQISAILIFDPDPKKPRDGLIWFINYNGITANKLKEIACAEKNPFDGAVIVVDEIHNLTRLMQGTIDPYLLNLPGAKRKIQPEPIMPGKWKPSLCGRSMNYKRGYLLYRLLIGAKNSKIIGLSGTPLINFPEELGILANILHGYVHVVEGRLSRSKTTEDEEKRAKQVEKAAKLNPYVDFIKAKVDDNGVKFMFTTLPEGIRKVTGKEGVERIPMSEPQITLDERIKSFKDALGVQGELQVKSESLLPPFGDQFAENFLEKDYVTVKNQLVLVKRLSGLISYYKGARKDLMPEVTKDEVVRVPLSSYAQEKYSQVRLEEIGIEEKQKKKKGEDSQAGQLSGLWAEIYDIKNAKQTNNYRMGSRQACNFSFPPGVNRPRPRDLREVTEEVGRDRDIFSDTAVLETFEDDEDSKSVLDDEADAEAADDEDDEVDAEAFEAFLSDERARLQKEAKSEEEIKRTLETLKFDEEIRRAGILLAQPQAKAVVASTVEKQKQELRCKADIQPGETYGDAIKRCKQCLLEYTPEYLKLEGENGLRKISPKYAEIITNINAAQGSSLVYSQFLDMEGIGIFTICLRANGWVPIKIDVTGPEGPRFSEETIQSFAAGKTVNRYIQFTGGESEVVRKYAVNIFNAKFSELPDSMISVLRKAGFGQTQTEDLLDNKLGKLCRLFCITSAGAEGLSLKNVRAVHIMEPYWNEVRMAQVKGRAVRICSHMDLAPEERNVEIFTYISVFGPEAQKARDGEFKIAETITNKDALSREDAERAGLKVPEGATHYTMTSDERLYVVSQRKKTVIDNLQKTMKSASVDCELNLNENYDGTFVCQKFTVGDFMYNPILKDDIEESRFLQPSVAAPKKFEIVRLKGRPLKLVPFTDPGTGKVVRFDMYEVADQEMKLESRVGTVEADPVTGKKKPETAKLI